MPIIYTRKRRRLSSTPSPAKRTSPPKRNPLTELANTPTTVHDRRPSKVQRITNTFLENSARSVPATSTSATCKSKEEAQPRKLKQLVLDLGGNPQKQCRICGMRYVPSQANDAALHTKHHDTFLNGEIISACLRESCTILQKYTPITMGMRGKRGVGRNKWVEEEDAIVRVDGKSRGRKVVERVMERVEGELGAVALDREELWGTIHSSKTQTLRTQKNRRSLEEKTALPTPPTSSSPAPDEDGDGAIPENQPRFAAFLYLHGTRVIGLCLAEQIHSASWMIPLTLSHHATSENTDQDLDPSTPIKLTAPEALNVGIARIWVLPGARRKGIAARLLDSVAANGVTEGDTSGKGQDEDSDGRRQSGIAFSQLTGQGEKLARAWISRAEKDVRVLVYDESGAVPEVR
ncbi:MAG: hypothetical protein Q9159_005024 [Coniocarpon cinnabarinum]